MTMTPKYLFNNGLTNLDNWDLLFQVPVKEQYFTDYLALHPDYAVDEVMRQDRITGKGGMKKVKMSGSGEVLCDRLVDPIIHPDDDPNSNQPIRILCLFDESKTGNILDEAYRMTASYRQGNAVGALYDIITEQEAVALGFPIYQGEED